MPAYEVGNLRDLARLLEKHGKERQKRVVSAARKAARVGRTIVKKHVPVAFGELREGVHDEETRIISDAPHAAAVENGSRPHWVPLEALIKWVKLRAQQGLVGSRRTDRLPGTTTAGHARRVAAQLKAMGTGATGDASQLYSDVDAPVQLAKQIQLAIAHHGTKPHHYMRDSVPEVLKVLDELVTDAIPDRGK